MIRIIFVLLSTVFFNVQAMEIDLSGLSDLYMAIRKGSVDGVKNKLSHYNANNFLPDLTPKNCGWEENYLKISIDEYVKETKATLQKDRLKIVALLASKTENDVIFKKVMTTDMIDQSSFQIGLLSMNALYYIIYQYINLNQQKSVDLFNILAEHKVFLSSDDGLIYKKNNASLEAISIKRLLTKNLLSHDAINLASLEILKRLDPKLESLSQDIQKQEFRIKSLEAIYASLQTQNIRNYHEV